MKILGIDPGTHRLGYGLIDVTSGRATMLDYGCIEPKKSQVPGDHLITIYNEITNLITKNKPEQIAIEELYFMQSVTTALRVAEARGVVLLVARQALIPLTEYKPTTVKLSVAGYGHATKQQMQKMVQMLLKLSALPTPDDAADGLAIAICHSVHHRYERRLQSLPA